MFFSENHYRFYTHLNILPLMLWSFLFSFFLEKKKQKLYEIQYTINMLHVTKENKINIYKVLQTIIASKNEQGEANACYYFHPFDNSNSNSDWMNLCKKQNQKNPDTFIVYDDQELQQYSFLHSVHLLKRQEQMWLLYCTFWQKRHFQRFVCLACQ